VPLTQRPVTPV